MTTITKENRPDALKTPISFNTYRLGIFEDGIALEFGNVNDEIIDVIASVKLKPELLKDLVFELFSCGVEYQDKFNKNIGFPEAKEIMSDDERESGI